MPSFHNSHYEKFLATGEVKCIDEEIPFEIPEGWEWAKLNDVCSYIQRGKSPVYSEIRQYPVIAQKCNQWSGFSIEKAQFISPETVEKYSEERILRQGDLLWNSTGLGTLGRIAVYIEALNPYQWAVADSHVTVIRPMPTLINSYFLYTYFASPTVQSVIEDKAEGSTKQKELYVDTIKNYIVPVPPFAEQCRIIEKLKNICPFISIYGKTQEKLDSLNSDLHSRLKKSILHEAIQGRLVPQDPADEPASVLLEQIRAEKQSLLKEGKLKKSDITDSVIFKGDDNRHYEKIGNAVSCIENEIPFEIPNSWQWVRLNDICKYIQRGKSPKYSDIKKFPVVAQKCNQWSGFSLKKAMFIDPDTIKSYGEERFLQDEDLMWNSTGLGTLGRMAIYTSVENPYGVAVADSHVTVIRVMKNYVVSLYLYSYFASNTVQSVIEDKADGSTKQKELATTTVKSYLVPLPPYNEQHRIVQRINELFAKL